MRLREALRWPFASERRENLRFILEIIGMAALLGTLFYTAESASATANSAKSAADSAAQARASVDAALEQINQGKYQAVYQQQLDLWRLAAEHPERSIYIIGGPDPETSAVRAAKALTLDFYAYVYYQLAPIDQDNQRVHLALDGSGVNKPNNVSEGDWKGWQSWSYTIAYGFQGTPSLCQQLRDNADAYEISFRTAVERAWLQVPTNQGGQNYSLEKVCP